MRLQGDDQEHRVNKSHALSGYLWWCELFVAPLASTKLARWPRSCLRFSLFGGLIVLVLGILLGCTEDTTKQEDVSSDAAHRVETNLLPELTDESEVVDGMVVRSATDFDMHEMMRQLGIG